MVHILVQASDDFIIRVQHLNEEAWFISSEAQCIKHLTMHLMICLPPW